MNTKRFMSAEDGSQVIEYALLISVVSIALTTSLLRTDPGLCEVRRQVVTLLASQAASACPTGAGGGSANGGGTGGTGGGGGGGGGRK